MIFLNLIIRNLKKVISKLIETRKNAVSDLDKNVRPYMVILILAKRSTTRAS